MAQGINDTATLEGMGDVRQLSPLVLAYIGDAYYEMVEEYGLAAAA